MILGLQLTAGSRPGILGRGGLMLLVGRITRELSRLNDDAENDEAVANAADCWNKGADEGTDAGPKLGDMPPADPLP